MEKAIIIIKQTKKKKFIAEIKFENGKTMPFPQLVIKDESLNQKAVEVERDAGQIVLVKAGDEEVYTKSYKKEITLNVPVKMHTQQSFSWQHEHLSKVDNPAYAPYNFVPLNEQVVDTPLPPNLNKYDPKRNTGWIDLEIETLTPLYIRGTLTEKEVREKIDVKDKPDFFSPAGKIMIPGSSLRGMVRSLVEIVSYSNFKTYENRRLYYRGLADRSNLRGEYQQKISSAGGRQKRGVYKFLAGVLRKSQKKTKGMNFEIVSSGSDFVQILKTESKAKVKDFEKKYREFEYYKLKEGYLVVSGNMQNKKRDWLIYNPHYNAEVIPIHNKDVENYYGDRLRSKEVPNLLDKAKKGEEVPCFYVQRKDEATGEDRISFGHTGMLRLAYEKDISEHIPKNVRESTKTDFAEAIFGSLKTSNVNSFAGRLFFDDAFLTNPQTDPQLDPEKHHILAGPKPTTFQHYLVQSNDNVRDLNHYNSNASIRGYKMYWHKSGKNERWIQTDTEAINKSETQYNKAGIRSVKKGTKFTGRIRFENLSNEELGALLFTLELPEGCCHKLGMGKPLGLGSVRITPKLTLSKREERYQDFFAEWNNNINPSNEKEIDKLKKEFERYVLQELDETKIKSIWETGRLKELLTMLSVEAGRFLEADGITRYMNIAGQNEFKDRPVLPLASSLAGKEIVANKEIY